MQQNAQFDIFVGNLPFKVKQEELQELFEQFGEISRIKIPTDRETGRPRGFAFISFTTQEAVDGALSMDGKDFQGRLIKVNPAKQRTGTGGGGYEERERERR